MIVTRWETNPDARLVNIDQAESDELVPLRAETRFSLLITHRWICTRIVVEDSGSIAVGRHSLTWIWTLALEDDSTTNEVSHVITQVKAWLLVEDAR